MELEKDEDKAREYQQKIKKVNILTIIKHNLDLKFAWHLNNTVLFFLREFIWCFDEMPACFDKSELFVYHIILFT